jgi:3-oxoacyl-[acyl-carrier protein] reductase
LRLEGRVALVTGAGRGIGRAIALRLAEEGAQVGVNDIEPSYANNTVKKILEAGGKALSLKADVTVGDEVVDICDKLDEKYGRLDILVNNAGIRKDGAFNAISINAWKKVIDTFMLGYFNCSQAVQKFMIEQGYGKIVCIGSAAPPAISGSGSVNYSTANSGIEGFTRALAVELGPYNINVNCIGADFIDTEMTRTAARSEGLYLEDLKRFAVAAVPLRRLGTTGDVANLAAFLVSDEASFITGQVICVRGGP